MTDDKSESDTFKAEYRADKRRNGWFSIIFGILFIAWTIFDIATYFWEEYWYANVFFFALGVVFVVYGVTDLKNSRK